jgi:DNA-directed RNA polymerase sigma subunit (sigma70/sigma32)
VDSTSDHQILADKGRVIRIPIHMLNTIKKCYFIAKHLTQEWGRDPSEEELAEYMNMSVDKVKEIMKISQDTASLDGTVDDDNITRLSDLIKDDTSQEPFESRLHRISARNLDEVLHQLSETGNEDHSAPFRPHWRWASNIWKKLVRCWDHQGKGSTDTRKSHHQTT